MTPTTSQRVGSGPNAAIEHDSCAVESNAGILEYLPLTPFSPNLEGRPSTTCTTTCGDLHLLPHAACGGLHLYHPLNSVSKLGTTVGDPPVNIETNDADIGHGKAAVLHTLGSDSAQSLGKLRLIIGGNAVMERRFSIISGFSAWPSPIPPKGE